MHIEQKQNFILVIIIYLEYFHLQKYRYDFHSKPRAKVDDQEVKVWRILLVPIQGEPLGDVDFIKHWNILRR